MRRSREGKRRDNQDVFLRLRSKKAGPYKVIRAMEHTVTIEIDSVYKVVSIDQINLARKDGEVDQQVAELTSDGAQSKQRNDQPTSGDGPTPQLGRKGDDALGAEVENLALRGSSEGSRQQEAGALAEEVGDNDHGNHDDTKAQVESTEYVVDRIVDHRDEEQRTLYQVR